MSGFQQHNFICVSEIDSLSLRLLYNNIMENKIIKRWNYVMNVKSAWSFKTMLQILRAGCTIMSIKVLRKIFFQKMLLQYRKVGNAVFVDTFSKDQSRKVWFMRTAFTVVQNLDLRYHIKKNKIHENCHFRVVCTKVYILE